MNGERSRSAERWDASNAAENSGLRVGDERDVERHPLGLPGGVQSKCDGFGGGERGGASGGCGERDDEDDEWVERDSTSVETDCRMSSAES
jgi:hypothetical protein